LILSLPHRLASLLGQLPDLLAMTSLVVTAMVVVVVVQTVTKRVVVVANVVASVGGLAVVGVTVAATVTSVLERFARRVHQPVNRPQEAAVMIRTGTSWTSGCGTIRSRLLRRCLHRLPSLLLTRTTLALIRRSVRCLPMTTLRLAAVAVVAVVAEVEAVIGGVLRILWVFDPRARGLTMMIRRQ
jgi:hypothetical protein